MPPIPTTTSEISMVFAAMFGASFVSSAMSAGSSHAA